MIRTEQETLVAMGAKPATVCGFYAVRIGKEFVVEYERAKRMLSLKPKPGRVTKPTELLTAAAILLDGLKAFCPFCDRESWHGEGHGAAECKNLADAIEEASKPRRRQNPAFPSLGNRWTADEDRKLSRGFEEGRSLAELAQAHGRKPNGVLQRLILLGKVAPVSDLTPLIRTTGGL